MVAKFGNRKATIMFFRRISCPYVELRFLLAATAIGLAACSLQSPLSADAAKTLHGRRLTTLVRRSPPLLPVRSWEWAQSGIGMSDAGERLVRENQISDPALYIARELGSRIEHRYRLIVSPPSRAAVEDDPTKIGLVAPGADLVLDVWTDSWQVAPTREDDAIYRVRYSVNLRLIDAKVVHPLDGKLGAVVAQGSCTYVSNTATSGPSFDELLADHARVLKDELDAAAKDCVQDLGSQILAPGSSD